MLGLVLGGARSGKSRYAASIAQELSDSPVMLATSRIWDEDHKARIERHKADRGPEWTTLEEPLSLARAVTEADLRGRVIVVDCVTLWLTNIFDDVQWDEAAAQARAMDELERVTAIDARFIFVSNELGFAPHAESRVIRKFVDAQGLVNQRLAERSVAVALCVAGIPVPIRGGDLRSALSVGPR